ncbi:MAG: hypothetical protein ABI467_19690 [Kofleriaceae bacterium]
MTRARTLVTDTLRLAGLLLAVALATSRLGLIAHELVGHGGTALAVGGQVTDVQLFWFAGGWIRYHFAAPPGLAAVLAISMGGVAIEAIAGGLLWVLARNADGLGRRLLRGVGAALVVHASWYFATGAWHGYGDGQLLHHLLGAARYPVAIAAGAVTCACAFVGARAIAGPLAGTLAGHRVAGLAVAAGLAGGVHAGLAIAEVRVRGDITYQQIMAPERERVVERDLERWAAYERSHGGEVTPVRRAEQQHLLEQAHRDFPFAWLLGGCVVIAVLAGARRSFANVRAGALTNGLLARAATCAAIAVAAVIAIDLVTR